ncbi:MAG TPA: two-component sensor histidine kinase [Sutterella sp.]|nr:two-component sensor histidine kinase [Sutterella sp.]
MKSIRTRLIWAFSLLMLFASLAAMLLTFLTARGEVDGFLDLELQQAAQSFETLSLSGIQNAPNTSGRLILQITDPKSGESKISHKIEPFALPPSTGFYDVTHPTGDWRIYALYGEDRVIVAAQPKSERMRLAFVSALNILQPLTLLLPFLIIGVFLIIGHGLSPLRKVSLAVKNRSATSLEPLSSENLPEELTDLVGSLNELLYRLGQSLDSQRRFASDAAHELRTPLAALKLQSQLLARAKTPEERQKLLSRLESGIDRASHLVAQLLTIARLDPQRAKVPFKAVDLLALSRRVADDLEPLAASKSIAIDVKGESVSVDGIEEALSQLIYNLTDNAVRYTQEGGKIVISVNRDADQKPFLRVEDNGPGIAPEDRDRIFDRFYRALGTQTEGNGLGLAIVAGIAQMHQAEIAVGEGLEGKGAGFTVRF